MMTVADIKRTGYALRWWGNRNLRIRVIRARTAIECLKASSPRKGVSAPYVQNADYEVREKGDKNLRGRATPPA